MSKIEGVTLGGDINGTSRQGYLTASYAQLVALLGEPNNCGDEYKVSTQWTVTFAGKVFTIYDYKETNLYGDKDAPSVDQFRALPSYEWHIGAHGDASDFIAMMKRALNTVPKPMADTDYLKQLEYLLASQYETAKKRIEHLRGDLGGNNPAHVLEWSADAFEAAGVVEVLGYALKALDKPEATRESIAVYALERILRSASGGSSSTSPVANHMDKCRGAAWVKLYEMVKP